MSEPYRTMAVLVLLGKTTDHHRTPQEPAATDRIHFLRFFPQRLALPSALIFL